MQRLPNIPDWFRIERVLRIAIVLLVLTAARVSGDEASPRPGQGEARVLKVYDGDTVLLRMGSETFLARLIGFDAPEMGQEPWGEKARGHLRGMLKGSGWKVSVETDIEQYDRYNRLLVYLWTKDTTFINEKMLADGYAVLFTFQPNSKYVDRFIRAQRTARDRKIGIWGTDGLKEKPVEYKKKHPRQQGSIYGR